MPCNPIRIGLAALVLVAAPAKVLAADSDGSAVPPVVYPHLPEMAGTVFDFIPEGWVIEKMAKNDLDHDGREDFAGVLRMRDPANILPSLLPGEEPLDSNPRILLVALREDETHYRRVLADHGLIPRREAPSPEDPFESIAIERNMMSVTMEHFGSAGNWSVTFGFRWNGQEFVLVSYHRRELASERGEIVETSIDYLRRQRKLVTRRIEDDRQMVGWETEPRQRLWQLAEIGNGLAWHPDRSVQAGSD